ncbi:MAG: dihydroorotase, partial [Gammaproteobacteria bacterium]
MQILTITQPDDFHLHLRDGVEMASVIADTAHQFGRAIIMPNLKPAIVTTNQALGYRERILKSLPEHSAFEPLMTLYLTEQTMPEEIIRAKQSGHIHAVKYYPAGATTNAENGVTSIEKIYPVLETMVEQNMPLLVHGEVADPDVDMFDREQVFIDRVLSSLLERYKDLRIVFEHITTREAVEFVKGGPDNLAATITPQHLLLNRDALYFEGAIDPHHYCLPVLKDKIHQQAIIDIVASGHPRFFLGTDSAPHSKDDKESACGCAGIYSAHSALELYAEVFEKVDCLERLEAFASHYGADFYGLPRNQEKITLEQTEWSVPATLPFGETKLVPFWAGETCRWQLK